MRTWLLLLPLLSGCLTIVIEDDDDSVAADDDDAADDAVDDDDAIDDDDAVDDDDAAPDADGDGSPDDEDCDDTDPTVHPGAPESCDGVDNDCNGQVDDLPPEPQEEPILFGVIGDFGNGSIAEGAVATMVKNWDPDFIVTTGDNNYPDGEALTIDWNIGVHYSEWIYPYNGFLGPQPTVQQNRFWPTLGNHDWKTPGAQPHIDYFTLPGNEQYYELLQGPVHFVMMDSNGEQPDGNTPDSVQGAWAQNQFANPAAPWLIAVFHHPPFNSGPGGNYDFMQWPFAQYGVDVVLTGHEHLYEQASVDGVLYVVNGAGGSDMREFDNWEAFTVAQFEERNGAQRVTATSEWITFEFWDTNLWLIDSVTLRQGADPDATVPLVSAGSTWAYNDSGQEDAGWEGSGFDDSGWATGAAPLGYGNGDEATAISYGGFPLARHRTAWFRTTFELDSACAVEHLRLRLIRDDGARVFLNGQEVFRTNLPAGVISTNSLAGHSIGSGGETTWLETWLGNEHLVAGTNTLAVEVRQHAVDSSDLRMDLELSAQLAE